VGIFYEHPALETDEDGWEIYEIKNTELCIVKVLWVPEDGWAVLVEVSDEKEFGEAFIESGVGLIASDLRAVFDLEENKVFVDGNYIRLELGERPILRSEFKIILNQVKGIENHFLLQQEANLRKSVEFTFKDYQRLSPTGKQIFQEMLEEEMGSE